MNKILLIFTKLMFVFHSLISFHTENIIPSKMLSIIQKQHFHLDEWRVYQKENLKTVHNFKEFKNAVQTIGNPQNVKDWQFERIDNEHYKATGTVIGSNGYKIIYTLTAIYSKHQYAMNISQTAIGQDIKSYHKLKLKHFNKEEKPEIFYTLTASIKEKYNKAKMKNEINEDLKSLSAKVEEGLEEDQFLSISAYSPLLKNSLTLENGKKMNMQLAMRNLENITTLTIGSPIIITEY